MIDFLNVEMPSVASPELHKWYFAVRFGRMALEDRVAKYKDMGIACEYDQTQILRLIELEQYLKMTWDEYNEARANAISDLIGVTNA